MKVLFACGGTAGHINPALAIAEELRKKIPDLRVLFIGAGNKMEKELIPNAGYDLANIRISGIKRSFKPKDMMYNLKTLRNLATAGGETERIIKEFSPHIVVGTGGYVCYPVLKKAAHMGIPTIVHESNAIPGLTTKLLSTIAEKVLVSFPGLEENYRRPERVVFSGTPVRIGFGATKEDSGNSSAICGNESNMEGTESPRPERKPLILSFWGSLGAARMNETIIEFIKLNIGRGDYRHIHAVGRLCDAGDMIERLKKMCDLDVLPADIEIKEYIDDMQTAMASADIVICRAGGSTIAELTAMGKPAVLIPSPYVANNEQIKNARQLEKAGGAIVLEEKDCTGEVLFRNIYAILEDEGRLKHMAAAQEEIGVPGAARNIAEMIITMAEKGIRNSKLGIQN